MGSLDLEWNHTPYGKSGILGYYSFIGIDEMQATFGELRVSAM